VATALERVLQALTTTTGHQPRRSGREWKARCPAHDDHNPSLSVSNGKGRVLLRCFADCRTEDVVRAAGLTMPDLFDEPRHAEPRPEVVARYPYRDEHENLLFTVERLEPGYRGERKTFRQVPANGRRGSGAMKGVRLVLYRLPEVLAAVAAGQPVFVVEGEKDVHALKAVGVTATCPPMGAGKARRCDWSPLADAEVLVIADRDQPGRNHARDVLGILQALNPPARAAVFEAKTGKDAADHLAAGHGTGDFTPTAVDPGEATAETEVVEPPPPDPTAGVIELDAFLEREETPYDWLVRGLLERRDRLILTGREGGGKSTLLRQICVQLAAGLHPFTLEPINPLRVLLVDLENSEAHTRRQLRPLRIAAGDRYKPEPGLHLRIRPEGLNLLDLVDAGWLAELAAAIRPDVLVTGPIYKLAGGDPTEEKTARHVALWLDRIRTETGCAVLLEAHAPYASNGSKRPERPYGASLWSRWPEFGLFLSPEGHLRHWRGARDERDWPAALQRGGAWPWTVVTRPRDLLWSRIAELCADAGDQLARRDLVKLTGTSMGAITRAIDEHRAEWDALVAPDDEGAA
jgi:hypothetical protein